MKILLLHQISPGHRPYLRSPIGIRFDSEDIPSSTEEQVAVLKDKLSSSKLADLLIDQMCLFDDNREDGGFEGDQTFKFVEVRYVRFSISFLFRNSEGQEVEVDMNSEVVNVL